MKILTKILYFFIFIFFLNIFFYYISSDYKEFLKVLKYGNYKEELKQGTEQFNGEINEVNINEISTGNDNLKDKNLKDKNLKDNNLEDNNLEDISIGKDNLQIEKEIVLGKNYKDILNKFLKIYDLDKIEVNTLLFEITNEYPDYYYEYYSKDLTLYFFTSKNYNQIYNMFDYLQEDGPFSVNEVNNFGEKSFYINLNETVDDNFIRLVITQNGITYGVKLKKSQYEILKNILKNNFNN